MVVDNNANKNPNKGEETLKDILDKMQGDLNSNIKNWEKQLGGKAGWWMFSVFFKAGRAMKQLRKILSKSMLELEAADALKQQKKLKEVEVLLKKGKGHFLTKVFCNSNLTKVVEKLEVIAKGSTSLIQNILPEIKSAHDIEKDVNDLSKKMTEDKLWSDSSKVEVFLKDLGGKVTDLGNILKQTEAEPEERAKAVVVLLDINAKVSAAIKEVKEASHNKKTLSSLLKKTDIDSLINKTTPHGKGTVFTAPGTFDEIKKMYECELFKDDKLLKKGSDYVKQLIAVLTDQVDGTVGLLNKTGGRGQSQDKLKLKKQRLEGADNLFLINQITRTILKNIPVDNYKQNKKEIDYLINKTTPKGKNSIFTDGVIKTLKEDIIAEESSKIEFKVESMDTFIGDRLKESYQAELLEQQSGEKQEKQEPEFNEKCKENIKNMFVRDLESAYNKFNKEEVRVEEELRVERDASKRSNLLQEIFSKTDDFFEFIGLSSETSCLLDKLQEIAQEIKENNEGKGKAQEEKVELIFSASKRCDENVNKIKKELVKIHENLKKKIAEKAKEYFWEKDGFEFGYDNKGSVMRAVRAKIDSTVSPFSSTYPNLSKLIKLENSDIADSYIKEKGLDDKMAKYFKSKISEASGGEYKGLKEAVNKQMKQYMEHKLGLYCTYENPNQKSASSENENDDTTSIMIGDGYGGGDDEYLCSEIDGDDDNEDPTP